MQNILDNLIAIYTNRYDPEGIRPLARLYWYTLVSATILIILSSIGYGVYQLLDTFESITDNDANHSGGAKSVLLDRAKLESTLSGFEARQTHFEQLKTNPPAVPDPSK